jgi:hypothetical protein
MTIYNIPIRNAAEIGLFETTVDLDGSDFQLYFHYNTREDFWYVDILDAGGEPILSGLKCVINWPYMRLCVTQGRPPGELLLIDPRENSEETGLDGLGVSGLLTYIDSASVAEL